LQDYEALQRRRGEGMFAPLGKMVANAVTDCPDCLAYWNRQPSLTAACASVGIEHGKSTPQMIREYLGSYHQRHHHDGKDEVRVAGIGG
jgi:hypothetical protein